MDIEYRTIAEQVYPGSRVEGAAVLSGGVSADVRRLDLILSNGSAKSIVLRIHGEKHYGHSATVEFELLKALKYKGLSVPKPLFVDVDCHVLPTPYLVLEFIDGTSDIGDAHENQCIESMANVLGEIHNTSTANLPDLPIRTNPMPEAIENLPEDSRWDKLRIQLESINTLNYDKPLTLLHGDFWPGNLLWHQNKITAVLDWEDAALGDPLSDVACCRLELSYLFGPHRIRQFTERYSRLNPIDEKRLALWDVYVAASALRYMGNWGLPTDTESYMRKQALASMWKAEQTLTESTN